MTAAMRIAPEIGAAPACRRLGASRATYYRRLARSSRDADRKEALAALDPSMKSSPDREEMALARSACRVPGRALAAAERQALLDALPSERFADRSPAEVYATLLDEGVYLGSIRTMHRLLKREGESRERRRRHQPRRYAKPELLATRPNELWSWDITKLLGLAKRTYYYLYVLLDVFSRYVVGWTLEYRESAEIAERLIEETCRQQAISPGSLTLHADRGASMTSKTVAEPMIDLDVTKTHARPHTSNDNPFSEAQFKTMKYRPEFPDRFESIDEGLTFCRTFFPWYNGDHHHGGLALMTPETVHYGRSEEVAKARQITLTAAYEKIRVVSRTRRRWRSVRRIGFGSTRRQPVNQASLLLTRRRMKTR
jgi:putative transposase